jgi:hypothetical protein
MPDRDALAMDAARGERLTRDAYRRDFAQHDRNVVGRSSWKFERRQHFLELNNPSWEAFRQGAWDKSLALLEGRREGLQKSVQEDLERNNPFYRVRVVQEPVTPYLHWELYSLRVQAQCGRPVRVVQAGAVGPLETAGILPEVVVLGGQTLYEVLYTAEGTLDGGVRFTDTQLAQRWESFIRDLYQQGEDVVSYVDRYLAHLPRPRTKE